MKRAIRLTQVLRAEGPAIHPAKGAALVQVRPQAFFLLVPAARPFRRNGRAAGTKRKFLMRDPVFQGCALRWANGWAFGPNAISAILQT
jgi:hypothetical protein